MKMKTRSKTPRASDPLDWVKKQEDPPGTIVKNVSPEIGKGVFAEKKFNQGEYLFEYSGKLKSADEVDDEDDPTYIFYFKSAGKNFCIDATSSKRVGRFANDEWRCPNAYVKKVFLGEIPKLLVFSRKTIHAGEEIRFDYGQKDAPWRCKVTAERSATNEGTQESALHILLEELHLELKRTLCVEKPDPLRCCTVMDKIDKLQLNAVLLKKHAEFVQTVKKIRGYKHNNKVAEKAEHLFNKLKLVFEQKNAGTSEQVERKKSVTTKENMKHLGNRETMQELSRITAVLSKTGSFEVPCDSEDTCKDTTSLQETQDVGLPQSESEELSRITAVLSKTGSFEVPCDSEDTCKDTTSLQETQDVGLPQSESEEFPRITAVLSKTGSLEVPCDSEDTCKDTTSLQETQDVGLPQSESEEDESNDEDKDEDEEYVPDSDDTCSDASLKKRRVSESGGSDCEELPLRVQSLNNLNSVVDFGDDASSESDSDPEEDDIIRDTENNGIFVRRVRTSETTKTGKRKKCSRVYNSRHFCPFCQKGFINFSQHILGKTHDLEPEVQKIKRITIHKGDSDQMKLQKSQERKRLLAILRNKGDSSHNKKVLQKKHGEFILGRRQNETQGSFSISEYGPCPSCLEWLKLSIIPRHQCPERSEKLAHETKSNLLMQSAILSGRFNVEASKMMKEEVFPMMRLDDIGQVARSDSLIVSLGNQWLLRNIGNELMRKYYASAVMRLSGRLLILLREMVTPPTGTGMEDYLDPEFFTHIAKGALKVAQQDSSDEDSLQAPSNAIKLAHDIKRMANIKLARAIESRNKEMKESATDFLHLMSIQWSTKLARVALDEKKHVKNTPLPIPSDVVKFSQFLKEEAKVCDLKDTSYPNYRKVVIVAMAALISYNRRRPGEVQAIKLSSYFSRKTGMDEITEEITGDITDFEKRLLLEQDVINIRGKGGKYVPVIVPSYTKALLEYVANREIRRAVGISSSHKYLFASNRAGVIRGNFAMYTVTTEAGLHHPDRIRASNMRRFMATMSQGLDISPQQQQWVVDHMGHTLEVHNIHYRATLDVIERIDISKILLMMDYGKIGRYKGKKLEEIRLEDMIDQPCMQSEQTEEEEEEEEEYIPDLPQEDEFDDTSLSGEDHTKKKARKYTSRHRWTPSEIDEIDKYFSSFFRKKMTPGEKAIKRAMRSSKINGGTIWQLPLTSIKSKVSWLRSKREGHSTGTKL